MGLLESGYESALLKIRAYRKDALDSWSPAEAKLCTKEEFAARSQEWILELTPAEAKSVAGCLDMGTSAISFAKSICKGAPRLMK